VMTAASALKGVLAEERFEHLQTHVHAGA
jgi:hypothetical protein